MEEAPLIYMWFLCLIPTIKYVTALGSHRQIVTTESIQRHSVRRSHIAHIRHGILLQREPRWIVIPCNIITQSGIVFISMDVFYHMCVKWDSFKCLILSNWQHSSMELYTQSTIDCLLVAFSWLCTITTGQYSIVFPAGGWIDTDNASTS